MDYIYEKTLQNAHFSLPNLMLWEKKIHLAQENEGSMLQKRKIMKCKIEILNMVA
jgi:hypothetical protein